MPIEIWKTPNGKWFWTCRSQNGEVISDSAELYSTRQKATQGAEATAKEFKAWQAERNRKSRKSKPKKATSARQKPGAKRSTSSSKPTRTTARRKG